MSIKEQKLERLELVRQDTNTESFQDHYDGPIEEKSYQNAKLIIEAIGDLLEDYSIFPGHNCTVLFSHKSKCTVNDIEIGNDTYSAVFYKDDDNYIKSQGKFDLNLVVQLFKMFLRFEEIQNE